MAWRLAKSLETLRAQVNAQWPNRSKTSDGTIGDARHAASTSDHNPNPAGVVTAMDITHDPAHGLDARKLAEMLVASRDKRIKYIISNAQIISSTQSPWVWRSYSGSNAHRAHIHISVAVDYDSTRIWQIARTTKPNVISVPAAMRLRMGQAIVDFEARRDGQGRIQVYAAPANDGGGAYEVAGINVTYHPQKAAQLRKLIEEGHHKEAEVAVRDYILEYTNPVTAWHDDPGVEFYLRDCLFNRGPKGAARILQRSVGAEDDGIVGKITRARIAEHNPVALLVALRAGREDYERNVVGYRANFWAGLTNRWDMALAIARKFSKEVK